MQTRLVAIVVVVCAFGCESGTEATGDGGTSAADASLPDPCTLLDAAEIESMLGAPATGEAEGADTAGGSVRRCSWKRKYSPELRTDEVVISVAAAAAYSENALVGSTAYAIGDTGQLLDQSRGVQIAWRKGARSASFRYGLTGAFTGDFEPLRTKAKALAQSANGRL